MRILPILALSLTCLTVVTHPLASQDDRGYVVKVGEPMPAFELTDLAGNTYTNASVAGRVVVLQFTASWCGVCRQEMPELEREVHQRFKDRNFLLLAVDFDETEQVVTSFAEQTGITYPIAPDPNGDVFHSIAARKSGVTRNVVIDESGTIRFLTRLYDPEEFARMVATIEALTSSD